MKIKKTRFGIDLFLQYKTKFQNTRFGLVTNNAATTTDGELSRIALLKAGFKIIKLFSPENGLRANGIDGAYQKDITDPVTGLPVISLYSEKLMPDRNDLAEIDIVVFDIPKAYLSVLNNKKSSIILIVTQPVWIFRLYRHLIHLLILFSNTMSSSYRKDCG